MPWTSPLTSERRAECQGFSHGFSTTFAGHDDCLKVRINLCMPNMSDQPHTSQRSESTFNARVTNRYSINFVLLNCASVGRWNRSTCGYARYIRACTRLIKSTQEEPRRRSVGRKHYMGWARERFWSIQDVMYSRGKRKLYLLGGLAFKP